MIGAKRVPAVALLLAGTKGANLLRRLSATIRVAFVSSYPTKGLRHDADAEIRQLCGERGYVHRPFSEIRDGLPDAAADLVLLAGWGRLLSDLDERFIVFHDSLLPKLRGFNPTVTALLTMEPVVGVTAFRPDRGIDSGPVCGQRSITVTYPATIRETYERLSALYAELAEEIVAKASNGTLSFVPQNEKYATYSLWRDESDYAIDWSMPATAVRKAVDAFGWPYLGAATTMEGRTIRVDRVELTEDLAFAIRQPGKIWAIFDGQPLVVCGEGLVRILEARYDDGEPVRFTKVRVRLGV